MHCKQIQESLSFRKDITSTNKIVRLFWRQSNVVTATLITDFAATMCYTGKNQINLWVISDIGSEIELETVVEGLNKADINAYAASCPADRTIKGSILVE